MARSPSPVHPATAASLTATPTHCTAATGVYSAHTPVEAADDEDLFRNKDGSRRVPAASAARCHRRVQLGLELCVLVLFLALLVVSFLVSPLQGRVLWALEIWKWCVMVIAVFSGHPAASCLSYTYSTGSSSDSGSTCSGSDDRHHHHWSSRRKDGASSSVLKACKDRRSCHKRCRRERDRRWSPPMTSTGVW